MNQDIFRLSEYELLLKRMYMNGNKDFYKSPMSFEAYKELIRYQSELSESGFQFSNRTKGQLGITLMEVEKISEGDEIIIFINERYSYPLLHNHSYIEMVFVYHGSCTHFIEGQSFIMNTGDFCILAPHAMHALAIESDDAIVFNILISRNVFNTSFLRLLRGGQLLVEFFENVLFNKRVSPYVIYPTKEDTWIKKTVLEMLNEYDKKSYAYKESLELYVKQLFIHIIRYYEMFAIVSDSIDNSMEDKIVAILGYISINFTHTSLKELASFFNYTETYISRMITHYTGKTYSRLITELQMKYAKELIESGNMNIAEISQMVGCFDASHFYKKFKKIYGKSPIDFRKDIK